VAENFQSAMHPVTRRLSESYLNQMRGAAIGGGGLSAAIVLLLLQTGLTSIPLHISLYAAALGIPAWIGAWQYIQPYILYGPTSYEHFAKPGGIGVAVLLAVAGLAALFVSFTSLIWHLSPCVATLFAVACLLVIALILVHNRAVQSAAEAHGNGRGA
jgi:phosphate/sulfate permease